jgi:hypothetical protein
MKKWIAGAAAVAALAVAANAQAASMLTGALSADNQYWAYISTDDNTLGTLIGQGSDWHSADSLTPTALTSGTYYLHIVAENWTSNSDHTVIPGNSAAGNPDGFIGQFSLSGTGYTFANGLTTLVTDTADWRATGQASAGASWSAPTGTLTSEAAYGFGPWASISGLPDGTSAQWVWSSTDPSGEAFFSTTISAVPEPATWGLMLLGFFGLGAVIRLARRKEEKAVAAA